MIIHEKRIKERKMKIGFCRVLTVLFPLLLAACQTGQKTRPACEWVTMARVETVLNDSRGFSATFLQTWPNGSQSVGQMVYMPGRLRMNYVDMQQPDRVSMVVVAKDKRMVAKKFDDQSITHIGLARNPLGLMLHQPLKLQKPILVTAIQHNANMIQISLASSDNPSQGLLTLRFLDQNGQLTLHQLQGVDARNHRTILDLENVHQDAQVKDSYFTYPDQQSASK